MNKPLYKLCKMLKDPYEKNSKNYLYAMKIDTTARDWYEIEIEKNSYIFLEKENSVDRSKHSFEYKMERINDEESLYFTDPIIMEKFAINKKFSFIDFSNTEWSYKLSAKYFE